MNDHPYEEQEDRNAAIVRARAEGATLQSLSDMYGVSVTRISRIIQRHKEREASRQVRRLLSGTPPDVRDLPAERVQMMYDALAAIAGNRLDLQDLAREWGIDGSNSTGHLIRVLAKAALHRPLDPSPPPTDGSEDII
ncbi:helix-turn-helix domain-containing protein [Microvirga sp. G4-2]|uniref:helix-turn-helix domain-containing protein n=1 Tax=Microvirga sp. G4-2 TaxID=3434467 RepID=UPI004044D95E